MSKQMVNGYCHEFPSKFSSCEDMELQCYTPNGREQFVEYRKIDGSNHAVFLCDDGLYRAQTCVALGLNPEEWEVVHQFS